MSVHTIILYHKSKSPMSKVWSDHETLKDALHYIILLYDRSLCNAYPKNTPKYCIEDVIDFLDNLYDVVFMTYEASVTAYVPHDIDWVKDRVRWYWDNKLVKQRKAAMEAADSSISVTTAATTAVTDEKKPDPVSATA